MRVPFRVQASNYDCVPTTILNALSYLFDRSEIPPLAVQRVYLYCLDSVSGDRHFGHGTTEFAVRLLAEWFGNFKTKKFSSCWRYLSGDEVHLAQKNPIATALNTGGVVPLCVTDGGKGWHYILALQMDRDWLYAYDPYPRNARANKAKAYEYLVPENSNAPNVRISRAYMDTQTRKGRYRLGFYADREAVQIWRGDT